MRGNLNHSIRLAAIAAVCAASLSVPAKAQPADTPATILDRCLRTLASDPKDFNSLINAGRAAVKIGDPEAAAGFFARADEVNPRSPYPQAGMGAVSVANGQPQAAMPYFARALQLGATVGSIGADRGLAYDLMGMQAQAQADYRAALSGADGTEARRRLALSLAISGDRAGALQTLAPLAASGDPATSRIRAFILALTGDANAAMVATDAAMPGSWASVAPFLKRLAVLQPAQKAAAVNLGIFPDNGQAAYAAAPSADRLADLEALLRVGPGPASAQPAVQPAVQAPPRPMQASYVRHVAPVSSFQPKIWLQLGSGSDDDALSGKFERLKSRNPDLFDGLTPYVARTAAGSRLLVGPFRGRSDAQNLASDFASVGIDSSNFTNSQADRIAPLAAE